MTIGSGLTELRSVFSGCSSLSSVTFSENSSLKRIDGAFYGCTSLTEINLPDGLEELSLSNTGLKKVTLPESVTKIYSYGFQGCHNLEKINIPSGITKLEERTFIDCPKLTAIAGGANVTEIGDSVFGGYDWGVDGWVRDKNLTSLGDIDFSKLTSVGDHGFYGVLYLPQQELSLDSIQKLDNYAFFNCNWITKLKLGDKISEIPQGAFGYCYYMTDITLPNNVTTIGDEAFQRVDAAKVTIGENDRSQLTSIGDNAFSDYQSGSTITINAAKSDVNLKDHSFGEQDNVIWTVESVDETGKVIYLDGVNGDDAKDGTTKEKAVRTFERAKAIAADNQNIEFINVIGTTSVSGDVTLDGTHAILRRDPKFNDYLLSVAGEASLEKITIDGYARKANAEKSLIYVKGATLNIEEGAVLQGNELTKLGQYEGWGGAVYAEGLSTINMSGGTIQNNTANIGGGICLDYGSTLNMTGGEIKNNHAVIGSSSDVNIKCGAGGGVALANKYSVSGSPMTFNLSGGTISGNTAESLGGGISLGWGAANFSQATLNMTGGSVTGNSAGSSGGGIFVQAGTEDSFSGAKPYGVSAVRHAAAQTTGDTYSIANISGGTISNNKMTGTGSAYDEFGGGGIYVNGTSVEGIHNGVLNLTNALIRDNTAAKEGGGYASCPTSETHIYVKNGAAFYSNSASSAKEIYILASTAEGTHSGNTEYTISPAMLGGTPYNWKYENGNEVKLNKLSGKLLAMNVQDLSLHTDVKSDAKAEKLAKVTISGNSSATRGGGIGSNGTVNIGKSDETEVSVEKKWNGSSSRPDSVDVELYCQTDGSSDPVYFGYETISPDDDGSWKLTFTNLPKNDENGKPYTYSVKERSVSGYTAAVTGNQADGFVITNSPVPSPSEKPSNSSKNVVTGTSRRFVPATGAE